MSQKELIQSQFSELKSVYPGLSLIEKDHGVFMIQGMLDFSATYNELTIEDIFDIEIILSSGYPQDLPEIREVGGRIPKTFHTFNDGTLCLGALLDLKMKFSVNPTLITFIQELVIPYLYSFCYKRIYKNMPYGELSHGGQGVLEFYCDLFNTKSESIAIDFLRILANKYRGHHPCPCGSGNKLRDCHGEFITKISTYQSQNCFMQDYEQCLEYLTTKKRKRPLINT